MKQLIILIFLIFTTIALAKPSSKKTIYTSSIQEDALEVLRAKCNVCHETKNPRKVFTLQNMDSFAKRIHRQVFVFKRMPKGNKITLTDQEKHTLKVWIDKQLNK